MRRGVAGFEVGQQALRRRIRRRQAGGDLLHGDPQARQVWAGWLLGVFVVFGVLPRLFPDKMPWVTEHLPKALLAEIEAELVARGELDGAQVRGFALGPVFATTVIQHGDQYRQKTVKACADVVSGSAQRLAKRQDHKLRTGDGANDPARTRSRDGAAARRCYIEHKTAAARRLATVRCAGPAGRGSRRRAGAAWRRPQRAWRWNGGALAPRAECRRLCASNGLA